jgi:hypothetical protein
MKIMSTLSQDDRNSDIVFHKVNLILEKQYKARKYVNFTNGVEEKLIY